MKRIMAAIMAAVLALTGLTGCSKQEPQPVVPPARELPGELIGVHYATGGGMMARSDFRIYLHEKEIEYTEFWPQEYADEMTVLEHVPITQQQWADVETVIRDLYLDGKLEAYQPKPKPENSFLDGLVLDGGDYTNLSLIWETADGTKEIGYRWPGDRRVRTLTDLLQELADPQGREITWYEPRALEYIWITRDHRLMTNRDYSYQFYWAEYDEDDPHWELIYYLGKHGEVASGRIRMEQADWDGFLAFAEDLQLEYFPETEKTDKRFTCKLSYTDDSYRCIQLNRETEERIEDYFLKLVQQKEN